jgi:type II secretory pathway component GspD/PulD (secretin)
MSPRHWRIAYALRDFLSVELSRMAFVVSALVDGRVTVRTFETAPQSFAVAVDWHVRKLVGVRLFDGNRTFTVYEFAEYYASSDFRVTAASLSPPA